MPIWGAAYAVSQWVAGMTDGARIQRRASWPQEIPRDVRGDVERSAGGNEVARVVTLVGTQGDAPATGQALIGHRERRALLGGGLQFADAALRPTANLLIGELRKPTLHQDSTTSRRSG
jgi:hypothetical protein